MSTQIPTQTDSPAPASALDSVTADPAPAIPASLQKFLNGAETMMHKAVESARPLTEAVVERTGGMLHSIQGQVGAAPVAGGEKSVGQEGQLKGLLEQGLGRVSATLSTVTTAIDNKTATDKHPGWSTMLQMAGKGLVERVEGVMEGVGEYPASTSAAAAAVAPFQAPSRKSSVVDAAPVAIPATTAPAPSATEVPAPVTSGPNTASTSSAPVEGEGKPVVTTTNSVAHADVA